MLLCELLTVKEVAIGLDLSFATRGKNLKLYWGAFAVFAGSWHVLVFIARRPVRLQFATHEANNQPSQEADVT